MKKIKREKLHLFEIEELACKILGLDFNEIDADTEIIEKELYEQLNIELDDFHEIVCRLIPLINIAKSTISDEFYKGFADVENCVWLTKTKVQSLKE